MHGMTRHFKADFDNAVDFLEDTHRVRIDRPVMFPGVIGGHCMVPNIELLLESYDSDFLCLILESNEKRKAEIKDKGVYEEVERIRGRTEVLQRELMVKFEERKLRM
jgi:hypothetical protein